jgi:hypothetical protein
LTPQQRGEIVSNNGQMAGLTVKVTGPGTSHHHMMATSCNACFKLSMFVLCIRGLNLLSAAGSAVSTGC